METTNRAGAVVTESRNNSDHRQNLREWLMSWRGFAIAGAAAAAAIVLTLSQQWLSARDLLPLVYLLPCAVMMAMCARGMSQCDSQSSGSGKTQAGNTPTDRTSQT
jgi:anti-sigma-K factor RskA